MMTIIFANIKTAFRYRRFLPSLILFLLLFLTTPHLEPLRAQPSGNAEILIDITSEVLLESESWHRVKSPVLLEAELPSPLKSRLIDGLLATGRQIRIEGAGEERLRLEWTTTNSLIRIDRNTARRTLSGNLTIYHLSFDRDVLGTEVIPFTYEDIVDADTAESLAGDWTAERFSMTGMEKRRSLWRRIAEPVVVIAATGVTVFLLYNVRSR